MTRSSFFYTPLAAFALAGVMLGSPKASAQNESLLAEVYGQGVHAYYAGHYNDAVEYLTAAIDGGTRDPRAYYFRGIVSNNQGRLAEAEADWMQGAELEAQRGGAESIGRSLSRFQGSARLKLEQIRQRAKLEAMKTAGSRSDTRMRQLGLQPAPAATAQPPAAARPAATPPPPAPSAPVADNPFSGGDAAMAQGKPKVESNNVLEGSDENPFADDPAPASGQPAAAGDAGDAMPFGDAPATDSPAADPFGGSDPFGAPAAGGADPFGGSDPFGG
ncbi:tetratricopeptide repeat protein [Stieleria sp. TO1_6]|uniref:tetratricopeptide repeat protein n=1 Tax=Stieleria tagensis TaxID=2956795 RepID=UPI00209B093D|nr:tetratricopeptide repeat protein [Stieleria tagensis]MCO8123740.1 tetratricopeptide repeat protein [Stieleria tagensis]